MVSNDDINGKLENKREGVDSDRLNCPKCGIKNTSDSTYCLECGTNLMPSKKKEVKSSQHNGTGFSFGNNGVKILGLIIIIIAVVAVLVFISGNSSFAYALTNQDTDGINNTISSYFSDLDTNATNNISVGSNFTQGLSDNITIDNMTATAGNGTNATAANATVERISYTYVLDSMTPVNNANENGTEATATPLQANKEIWVFTFINNNDTWIVNSTKMISTNTIQASLGNTLNISHLTITGDSSTGTNDFDPNDNLGVDAPF